MPRDQALDANLLAGVEIPRLVQKTGESGPRLLVEKEVVALRDDQRHALRYCDCAGDRLLDVAAELRRVDKCLGRVA